MGGGEFGERIEAILQRSLLTTVVNRTYFEARYRSSAGEGASRLSTG